jgi:hypothetical protein
MGSTDHDDDDDVDEDHDVNDHMKQLRGTLTSAQYCCFVTTTVELEDSEQVHATPTSITLVS